MPVTTIKRCQSNDHWYFTVEDVDVDCDDNPKTGLTITYFDLNTKYSKESEVKLNVNKADALLIRDAINQLYPQSEFPAT